MRRPVRIVKVGGSLLSLPDLGQRLSRWLAKQAKAQNVLLTGGGPLADEVRQWDERFGLGQQKSHWLCVDLLDTTAQLLGWLLPEAKLCQTRAALSEAIATAKSPCLIFAPARFLRYEESTLPGETLPRSWDVTSDSIAARLAEVMQADELVILKSALPTESAQLSDRESGFLDRHFPFAAKGLSKIRLVDLRNPAFPEMHCFKPASGLR
jgi:5-(aminomethyl)-3-furanmethanol phosphate kinase